MQPTLDSHGGHETFFSLLLICLFFFCNLSLLSLKFIIYLFFTLVLVLLCFINTLLAVMCTVVCTFAY